MIEGRLPLPQEAKITIHHDVYNRIFTLVEQGKMQFMLGILPGP